MSLPRHKLLKRIRRWSVFVLLCPAEAALGQSLQFPGQDAAAPVEIIAQQELEWDQNSRTYVARGDARVSQGEFSITADILTAHYRKNGENKTEIWRVDADGHVKLHSATLIAHGSSGVYDVLSETLTLKGPVQLDTTDGRITARDSLVYQQKEGRATVRGRAIATRDKERVSAETLVAHIQKNDKGEAVIHTVEAFDDVVVTTPRDTIRSHRGIYNAQTRKVTMTGDVRITRGLSQMTGDTAEVNLKTGVSRLKTGGKKAVRGVMVNEATTRGKTSKQ